MFVNDGDASADAAARREGGDEFHVAGLENGDEVVEDAVSDVFVEDALVPKALQVRLETLELDALLSGRVGERQRAEIGLAGLGADGRELGADDFDDIVAAGKLVVKGFQKVAMVVERLCCQRGCSLAVPYRFRSIVA